MSEAPCDILVIGGGPVGLAAALYAVRAGRSVTVLEPQVGAIDKACGEGLMPGGVARLADLQVQPSGMPIMGIAYLAGSRCATADFRAGEGMGVRRTTLHEALATAVRGAGVAVLPVGATSLRQNDTEVVVTTREGGGARGSRQAGPTMRGRHVVAADGLHSPTRDGLGLTARCRSPKRWGQRRHYSMAPWTDHVEVYWSDTAEAYVTPVADDLVGVAVLSRGRTGFDAHLSSFPQLRARLAAAVPVSGVRGAGPLRQRSSARTAGRILLVGDASGYVDSLTGEGISLGMAHARAAVAAISREDPHSYERLWRSENRRYAVMTHLLVQGTRLGWARRGVVPLAQALPAVFSLAVNQLGREQ